MGLGSPRYGRKEIDVQPEVKFLHVIAAFSSQANLSSVFFPNSQKATFACMRFTRQELFHASDPLGDCFRRDSMHG